MMKTYELLMSDEDTEVYAISLVSSPAIEEDWVYFNKEAIKFATVDDEKRIIVSPVLIPDKKILRISGDGEQYQVYLSAETIEKLAQRYLEKGYQKNATLEHSENIDGKVSVVESWVSKSREKDKSALYFDKTFPTGTWFIAWKVLDDTIWNDYVKTGMVKGASIEGYFEHQLVKASKVVDTTTIDLEEQQAEIMLEKIKDIIKEELGA